MPTLNWIGKEAVINHHKEVPFRLLRCDPALSVGEPNGNLLIEGDNLEALKALLPYYAGQVKCIYIDPPYNTGNENWVYNDNVNSPQIRAWLGKVVGGEGEDLSRHDKWLCMMYPRLKLLRELLRDDGVIFISIDENEAFHLGLLCDEIFHGNRIGNFVWESRGGRGGTVKNLAIQHEFVLAYAKVEENVSLKPEISVTKGGRYFDDKGAYSRELLRQWGQGDRREDRPSMFFPIYTPDGKGVLPLRADGTEGRWRFGKKKIEKMLAENDIDFVEDGDTIIAYRKVRAGRKTRTAQGSLLLGIGTASTATRQLKKIFGYKVFDTPKPVALVEHLIDLATYDTQDAIVLDSFVGSGTTGHAVLQMNKEDGGDRRFILVELEPEIARNVTAERLRQVIEGYTWTDSKGNERHEGGLGGGFRYCTLGQTIFHSDGAINDAVTFEDLARHIWFTETRNPWPGLPSPSERGGPGVRVETCLGTFNGVAYYLYFNPSTSLRAGGIGGNVFGPAQLAELPFDETPKVVYADTVAVEPAELDERKVTFKQIPYDVKVY